MDSNLVKARSSIVWILAIVLAFSAVWWIERETGRELIARSGAAAPAPAAAGAAAPGALAPVADAPAAAALGGPAVTVSVAAPLLPASLDLPADPAPRTLSPTEQAWARTAWRYFENNTDAGTGLASSVQGFPSATLWDTGSYLMAILSAHELGILDQATVDKRLALALASLARLPLFGAALPNKVYDTRSLALTDYGNRPSAAGVGWSAIDIGRLLVPLHMIAWRQPRHAEAVRRVISRWNTAPLVSDGQLFGMSVADGGTATWVQEGRLGYEQYAARSLALMGLDVEVASSWREQMALVEIEGIPVPVDRRAAPSGGAQNFLVSEPLILTGLEFGWDRSSREVAWRLLRAQQERYRRTGVLTAVTEDHVDQAPYFVYNSVFHAGRSWVAVTERGEDAQALRSLSVKAAFGWHALYRNGYTERLVQGVAALNDPARGWYAGLYEADGRPNRALTANTNGVVLESLAFITRGPALRHR